MVKFFVILIGFMILSGCASEPDKPVHKYHSANSVNDLFEVEQGMPVREVKQQDFFFKHCVLEERRPFLGASEYSCNSGPFSN